MHPERKGQREGSIDAGVAILDGIGLLFFIIPGVIAYAVDFSNGTIYLPNHRRRASADRRGVEVARFDPKRASREDVERLVEARTGVSGTLDDPRLQVMRLSSIRDAQTRVAREADSLKTAD
jgi:hypothetical protein